MNFIIEIKSSLRVGSLFIFLLLILSSCNHDKRSYDVIVVGGGLMGSSAGWKLAESGSNILILEKQDSSYSYGSSQGEARIARSNNRGNDMWSYMHNTTLAEVKELVAHLNNVYSGQVYSVEDIYTSSPVSYLGKMSIYDRLMASLIRQNIDYKIAATPEAGRELFDVNLPDDVLLQREYNAHSGTINPRRLIDYMQDGIRSKGSAVQFGSKVMSINKKDDEYLIVKENVSTGEILEYRSKNVVSAAGPYTGDLLENIAPYFKELINPQRVFLGFYKIEKDTYLSLDERNINKLKNAYPVINSSKGTRDGSFFSMIEYYDEDEIPVIKIGGHFQRSDIANMDEVWKLELNDEEKEWAFSSTMGYFELLNLPLNPKDLIYDHGYSCVYSLTENEIPIISPVVMTDGTVDSNFVVMAGMSGVGAKGALAYGMMAADFLNGINRQDTMYHYVRENMGLSRLQKDIKALKN